MQKQRRFASIIARATGLAANGVSPGGADQLAKAAKPTLITMLTGEVVMAGTVRDQPNVLVNILVGTDRVPLFKYAVPFRALVGNARQPFVLPEPFELASNEDCEVVFTNKEAQAVDAYVALIGSAESSMGSSGARD